MTLKKSILYISLFIIFAGFLIPQKFAIPVEKADNNSYNKESFWFYPWGKSVTHKGVDIFAKEGTNVLSATKGLVIFKGYIRMGGNVVLILGPKWRLHYYAHLKELKTSYLSIVERNEIIGTVGTSGNAAGKAPHLHYSILTIFPYPWRIDLSRQGWKKMFYLNPINFIKSA